MMDWYASIRRYLGKFADLPEVDQTKVEQVVSDVCASNGVSYQSPKSIDRTFVIYEALSQLFLLLATEYADKYEIPIAIGVQIDKTKITRNFIELSEQWAMKAEDKRANLTSTLEFARVDRDLIDDNAPILSPPIIRTEYLRNGNVRISWDASLSHFFTKYVVYVDGIEAEEITNRYQTYHDTEPFSYAEIRIYSGELYSSSEVEL